MVQVSVREYIFIYIERNIIRDQQMGEWNCVCVHLNIPIGLVPRERERAKERCEQAYRVENRNEGLVFSERRLRGEA